MAEMEAGVNLAELSRELERAGCGIVMPSQKIITVESRLREPVWRCGPEIRAIILEVAKEHLVSTVDIMGRCRAKHIIAARHAAIRAVAEAVHWEPTTGCCAKGWTITSIAKVFGLDHSTILYVLGRLKKKCGVYIKEPRPPDEDPYQRKLDVRKAWYAANKEKIRAYYRAYHEKNIEKIRAQKRAQDRRARLKRLALSTPPRPQ